MLDNYALPGSCYAVEPLPLPDLLGIYVYRQLERIAHIYVCYAKR
jgi:hypothetical protein